MNALLTALMKSSLEEAAALIRQGEKLPRNLHGYETRQIFEPLFQNRAFTHLVCLRQQPERDRKPVPGQWREREFQSTGIR
ncbi:hypothetical protein HB364_15010 [Pseudoflavitalea sp. X16]|uniref:hypothetical protein n=1 Tax=Paraflavitalea devenefica TaxID=2716334 RepID=UPI001420084C|nr:hypothetical protein [Paraflavitalea devenefica]NII26397.1 hypothetical protein [Paraflavitalea devenefica]